MAKRSDAIFAANMPRRKNRRIGAILSGSGLVIFLAAAFLLMPREMSAVPQRLLGLLCAAWAWLTWWLATYKEESPEELLYRLRRVQSSDFGKQLAMQPRQRTIKLPGVGEVAWMTLGGLGVFLLMGAWWLSPWAPVRVSTLKIEDLTIPLGEQITAIALAMPDGHTALAAPPALPQRAKQIAKVIRENADPYPLGTKAIAEGRFKDARMLLETASKEGKGDAAKVELARGQNEIYAGEYAAAIPLLEGALAKSPDDPVILSQLAAAHIHLGQANKAEPLVAQAAKVCREKLGDAGAATAGVTHLQAILSVASGKDYEKAQGVCRQTRDILAKAGEAEQQNLIAPASLNNQAVLYVLCGKYYGGEELFKGAQDGWQHLSGEKHADAALVLSNLAVLDACLARWDSAKSRFEESLAILKENKEKGDSQPLRRVAALCGLSGVSAALADFESGRKIADEARALAEKELGVEHKSLAIVHDMLGQLSAGEGQWNQADAHFLRGQAFAKKAWGASHPFVAAVVNHQTGLYLDQARYPEADAGIKQVLDICKRAGTAARSEEAEALFHRGLSAIGQDRARAARGDLDKALAIERDIFSEKNAEGVRAGTEEHPDIARTLGCLASLDNSAQTYSNGVSLFDKAIAMAEKLLGDDHPTVAELLVGKAKLHMQREKMAEALDCLEKALEKERKRLPPSHPSISATLEATAEVCEKLDPPQADHAKKLRAESQKLREKHEEEDRPE